MELQERTANVVSLTPRAAEKIRELMSQETDANGSLKKTIISEHVHRVPKSKIKVSLNVGVVIPSTIELRPLPATIVKVVPEYEGYLFFVLDDGTIVIVEPGTLPAVRLAASMQANSVFCWSHDSVGLG